MTTANLDAVNLKAAEAGGLIREDVMNQLWDLSENIETVFTNTIGSDTCKNDYTEWTLDELAAPDIDNAAEDGQQITGNDASIGTRVGNNCQISTKRVAVSFRADTEDSIARAGKTARQLMRHQEELRRDVEAILLTPQASVKSATGVTPRVGGFPSWCESNYYAGASGAAGGFNTATQIVDAPTPGDARGLTETLVKTAIRDIHREGGKPTKLMSSPEVIAGFSDFMFDESARIATLLRDKNEMGAAQAQGAVNMYMSNFNTTLDMVDDILLQPYESADDVPVSVYNVFVYDPNYCRQSFLQGYQSQKQGTTGLSEEWQMSVDYTLKVLNEKACAVIADVDPTIAVAA